MSETSCVNATVAVVGNPTSNKGKGAEVGKQVVELLQEAGRKHGFNVTQAARELGLTRPALYRRMARHGL